MNLRRELARSETLRNAADRAYRIRAAISREQEAPRVLVNSIPKAGTHLLTSILPAFGLRAAGLHLRPADLGGGRQTDQTTMVDHEMVRARLSKVKRGQFVSGHFRHSDELTGILDELGFRTIFVVRDPRDLVVSAVDYLTDLRRHINHEPMARLGSDPERLRMAIDGCDSAVGDAGFPPLAVRLSIFEPWLTTPGTHVVRFEEVVGADAEGGCDVQRRALTDLADALGQSPDSRSIDGAVDRISGQRTATFNQGRAGRWRERFDRDTLAHFYEAVPASLLESYGYPVELEA